MTARRSLSLILLASLVIPTGAVHVAFAEPTQAAVKEAAKHFERGVGLYTDTDYRAALVEFRRAYELAPNSTVLYNIGETYYQLQNYSAALVALQRYLSEAGSAAQHRAEIDKTIDILQSRVGHITVTTNVPDCDVAIDDEPVGRTPLAESLIVSVGRRKVTVTHPGRAAETRQIDVSAGDTVQLPIAMAETNGSATAGTTVVASAGPQEPPRDWATIGWITTGVLGAGAIGTGVFAFISSRQLKDARDKFPADPADIKSKSSRVSTFSVVADVLGVATLVTAGISLKLQLSKTHDHEAHLAVAPNGVQLIGWWK
ncbi:MAG TPA: PEGA domain-containing protein [Kofleriaceae bacterium]